MLIARSVLLIVAVVIFGIAAFSASTRVNLTNLGLAFFAGAFLVP